MRKAKGRRMGSKILSIVLALVMTLTTVDILSWPMVAKASTLESPVGEEGTPVTSENAMDVFEDDTISDLVDDSMNGLFEVDQNEPATGAMMMAARAIKSCEGEIKACANLVGRAWTYDDTFEFTITPLDDAPSPEVTKVSVTQDSAGYVESFGKITFTGAGEYTYVIYETHKGEKIDDVNYDPEDKTVTMKVKEDEEGNLVADGTEMVQTVMFTNSTVEYVPYLDPTDDKNGNKTCDNYVYVTGGTTEMTTGWYVVKEVVTVENRIAVSGDVNLILCDGAKLTVNGGIGVNQGNSLTIYGQSAQTGALIASGESCYSAIGSNDCNGTGKITINGGNVTANGGYKSAGIGGGRAGSGGVITINGGTVNSIGGQYGPGIGGGGYKNANVVAGYGGDVTITGGTITATGGMLGAGIGGGLNGDGGTVSISGGIVTANGGNEEEPVAGGAGIGGGGSGSSERKGGDGGTVIISGGTVYANGFSWAAGIGGGCGGGGAGTTSNGGKGGTVQISGGTVYANGGHRAAGIGGANGSPGGTVEITGGRVVATAISSNDAKAIGHGEHCADNGTLTLGNEMVVVAGEGESKQQLFEKANGVSACQDHYWATIINEKDLTVSVSYVDAAGVSKDPVNAYPVDKWPSLVSGWYAVKDNITIDYRLNVNGDVNLILCDGAELTASKGINVGSGHSLTIYGQSEQTGALIASGESCYSAIGSDDRKDTGTITINGGNIRANGGYKGAGIGGGRAGSGGVININGGKVNAVGGSLGPGIGGGAYMNVNTVAGYGGDVTITGGTVTATGGEEGAGIGGGYGGDGGTVKITGGCVVTMADGSSDARAIGHGNRGNDAGTLTLGDELVVAAGKGESSARLFEKANGVSACQDYYWASIINEKDVTESISYVDAAGVSRGPVNAYPVDKWPTLGSGWYTVKDNATLDYRLNVDGDVNLILCDGAVLTASKGINVGSGNSLTIYGQSKQTGALIASGESCYSAIGSDDRRDTGTITINGGNVTANGGYKGAGIGGGRAGSGGVININGGKVNATGGEWGPGIGGGGWMNDNTVAGYGGDVTITGGTVTATGGRQSAGIGGGYCGNGGKVVISGGFVTANGGGEGEPTTGGAGIGGGGSAYTGRKAGDGGTVIISGGTVYANGFSWGAGIGGGGGNGYSGTTSNGGKGGTVQISGGTVYANGGHRAAGIGGANGSPGGTVEILGGRVLATTISANDAQAIGHGEHNDDAGTLNYDGMKVYDSEASDAKPVIFTKREETCRSKMAKLTPCDSHVYTFYLNNGSNHTRYCNNCGVEGATEQHAYVNHVCVCEAEEAFSYVVTFIVKNGSWNEGEGEAATADKKVTLTGKGSETLTLLAEQIPAVGNKPDNTYKEGSWDATPSTETVITEATTYTYTYAKKEAAVVTKAPTAKKLTYNGQSQELVTAGEATGGTTYYALGTDATTKPAASAYSASIQQETKTGTYYVWYKAVGDADHLDSEEKCIEVAIGRTTASLKIESASREWTYDGDPHTYHTYVVTYGEEVLEGIEGQTEFTLSTGDKVKITPNAEAVKDCKDREWNSFVFTVENADCYDNVLKTEGNLTISKREVTVTARSKEFTYDGKTHSLDEYDVTGLVGNDEITAVVTGSITYPGEGTVANQVASYEFKTGDAGNYSVTTEDGALNMKHASVAITITAASGEWVYDGNAHGNGAVSVTSGKLFDGDELVAKATGSVTSVMDNATGNNAIAAGYKVMNGDEDVTANYEITAVAGTLTIKPRKVTITVRSKEFTYDGKAQSLNEYDVTGLVGNDEITAVVTGSITYPGEGTVANQVASYEFKTGDAGNYSVTTENGVLTMKNASVAITITAADGEWVYDGNAHGNDAVSVTSGKLFDGDELVAKATGSVTSVMDNATGNNAIAAGYKVMNGDEDVTASYVITAVAGTLTIKQREVTVTVADVKKEYNGSEQAGSADVTFDNVVSGETATISYVPPKGKLIAIYDNGSFDKNSFRVVDGKGKDLTENYVLGTMTAGKLTVTDRSEKYQIMVMANSSTANVYDGNEKSAVGFETLKFTVDGNVYVVEGLTTSDPRSINVCNLENVISGKAIVKDVQGNDVTAQFTVETANGWLEITPKTITVTADGKIKDTEMKDPELTYTVTGLVGSDTVTGALVRQTGERVGTYAILQGTLTAGSNYRIHYVGAYLIILQGDYLDPLRELLRYAISLGGERTVTWDKGTGLTYDILKTLQDHPEISLIFQYNYLNVSYEVTIRGKDVVVDPDVPWYGPMNLYGRYGLKITSINPVSGERTYKVVRGDNLTKIARRFSVTVDWLVKMNMIKNPNLIWVSQVLKY